MELKIELKGVKEALATLDPRIVKTATVRALNKSAASGKTAASKEIRASYTISKTDLDKNIAVRKVTQRSDIFESQIVASSSLPKSRIPLINFKAKQAGTTLMSVKGKRLGLMWNKKRGTKEGAQVLIKKAAGWKTIKGAFIAKMKSGHIGVFQRKDKARKPIKELTSIDVPLMFSARDVIETVKRRIQEQWDKTFKHELDYERKKKR